MEKFKKFEIKKNYTIVGGDSGMGINNLDWESTRWVGNGGAGTDRYNSKWNAIWYI